MEEQNYKFYNLIVAVVLLLLLLNCCGSEEEDGFRVSAAFLRVDCNALLRSLFALTAGSDLPSTLYVFVPALLLPELLKRDAFRGSSDTVDVLLDTIVVNTMGFTGVLSICDTCGSATG